MDQSDFEEEDYDLTDSIDNAILMHRDAHFGGSFEIMLEYYVSEGKGVFPGFELQRIKELALLEKEMKKNLAGELLSGPEAEKVQRAREAYRSLREIYEKPKLKSKFPRLIADLVLSEDEYPEEEIKAIVAEKGLIVPFLIDVLRSEDFHDPIFPGYGRAPVLAAHCLGNIGDKRALISLFESIGESDFFDEDVLLQALKAIGPTAKDFLLKVMRGKPFNFDNERAAIALIQFKDDPEVAAACLEMVLNPEVWKNLQLSTYLILTCEGLQQQEDRVKFASLCQNPAFPKQLHQDVRVITKLWQAQ